MDKIIEFQSSPRHPWCSQGGKRNLLVSILTTIVAFGLALTLALVVDEAQQSTARTELLAEFTATSNIELDYIEQNMELVSKNLRLTAKAVEMLPFNASASRMYPILATSAGLMDESGQFTATAPYGPVAFLQHMVHPYTRDRMETIAAARGVDLDTYQAFEVVESATGSQRVQPLNVSSPDIYMITHASNLPLTYNQTQLQRSGIFLTDFSPEPNNKRIIAAALKNNSVTSRAPFFVPAGFTAITILAPVYFNEWSNDDPIASETDYRGVVVQTVWNVSLVRAVDLGFPVWFQLRDIEMNEPFITSRSDAVPLRDVEVDSEPLRAVRRISAFSRTYEVEVFPTQRLLDEFTEAFHHPWTFYFGIVAGLVFSFLLGCVVYVLLRRASSKRSMAKLTKELESEKKLAEAETRIHEQVLGYIHHEVRNPLNIVMGTVELIMTALTETQQSNYPTSSPTSSFVSQPPRMLPSPRLGTIESLGTEENNSSVQDTAASRLPPLRAAPTLERSPSPPSVQIPFPAFEEILEELNLLKAAGVQMEQHVNDMLDLQRLRRRELVLNPLPCNILGCLQSIANFYRSQSRVPIFVQMLTAFPGVIVVDEGRIRQIMTNGLLNAMAHTPSGSITMQVEMLRGKRAKSMLYAANRKAKSRMPQLPSLTARSVDSKSSHSSQPKSPTPQKLIGAPSFTHVRSSGQSSSSDSESEAAVLRLTIRDTGTGLGGVNVEDLFKSFMSMKRTKGGTVLSNSHSSGLGLSICELLAESMGGGADLQDVGNGCEFSCVVPVELRDARDFEDVAATTDALSEQEGTTASQRFPLGPPSGETGGILAMPSQGRDKPQSVDSETKDQERPVQRSEGGRRALVIDDDPTNVKLVSRMLKLQGVQSHGISTGNIPEMVEEALRRAGHLDSPPESGVEPFNFVLLDIRLGPTLSGVDILRELKPRLRGGLPVFAMTANTRESDVLEYKSTGFSGLLSKPVSRKKVASMLIHLSKLDGDDQSFWQHK